MITTPIEFDYRDFLTDLYRRTKEANRSSLFLLGDDDDELLLARAFAVLASPL